LRLCKKYCRFDLKHALRPNELVILNLKLDITNCDIH